MQSVYKNILLLVAGFCVLQLVFGDTVFLIIALSVLVLAGLSQRAAELISAGWMKFGSVIGRINAAVLLFIIFYLVLTPIALLSRMFKKDPLQLTRPSGSNFVFKHHAYRPKDLADPW